MANGNMSVLHWFYKGLQLTIRFCSRRQGPNGFHSGMAEGTFKKTKENQRFPKGRHRSPAWRGGPVPVPVPSCWQPLISYWFYKGLQLTVRFCSRRQCPNGFHSGMAEGSFKKTKENQRFPMGRPRVISLVHTRAQFPSRSQRPGTTDFLRFHKVFRLTIRFPGILDFWPRRKCMFSHWFWSIPGDPGFLAIWCK